MDTSGVRYSGLSHRCESMVGAPGAVVHRHDDHTAGHPVLSSLARARQVSTSITGIAIVAGSDCECALYSPDVRTASTQDKRGLLKGTPRVLERIDGCGHDSLRDQLN